MSLEDILENVYFTIIYDYVKRRGITVDRFVKFVELLKIKGITASLIIKPVSSDIASSKNDNNIVRGLFYMKNPKIWKDRKNVFIGYEEDIGNNNEHYHYYIAFTARRLSKTKRESRGFKILPTGNILLFIIKDYKENTKEMQNDLYLEISAIKDRNSTYLRIEETIIRNLNNIVNAYIIGSCNSNEIEKCNTKIIDHSALSLDNIKNIVEILSKFADLTLNKEKDIIFDEETYKSLDKLLDSLEKISKKTKYGIPSIRIFYSSLKSEIDRLRNIYLESLTSHKSDSSHVI